MIHPNYTRREPPYDLLQRHTLTQASHGKRQPHSEKEWEVSCELHQAQSTTGLIWYTWTASYDIHELPYIIWMNYSLVWYRSSSRWYDIHEVLAAIIYMNISLYVRPRMMYINNNLKQFHQVDQLQIALAIPKQTIPKQTSHGAWCVRLHADPASRCACEVSFVDDNIPWVFK